MKFLPFEAKGIVDLVSSSPLLSWLYLLASEQAASNLIGIFDWLALLLLAPPQAQAQSADAFAIEGNLSRNKFRARNMTDCNEETSKCTS